MHIKEQHIPITLNSCPAEPAFANSVDPDQLASEEANWSGLASEEANWSGSALFVIKCMNSYQQPGSSNLIGWKLEVGLSSYFIQQGKG